MATYSSLAERVLGIHPPFEGPAEMLSQAYTTLTGDTTDIALLLAQNETLRSAVERRRDQVGLTRALYEIEPNTLEKSVTLNSLTHIFKEGGAAYGTVLGAVPLYHALYTEHAGPPQPEARGRNALLVGSISPVSSAAFVALSQCVFRAEPWIVDPYSAPYKQRHGSFVQANGLALPESWANSMHAAVTNRLLHMLLDTDGQLAAAAPASEQSAGRRFAGEMFRILEAGGHLLLCEQPPKVDPDDPGCEGEHNRNAVTAFDESMRIMLSEAGFSAISITAGQETGSSDFLFRPFDPSQPFAATVERPYTRAIYAQKPTI